MNSGTDEEEPNDIVITPRRNTIIALDFDRTFTSDIEFWRLFVMLAVKRGHTVICVTGRSDSQRSRDELRRIFSPKIHDMITAVIFCNHCPKRDCAANAGWEVDIWIDDFPESVGAPDRDTIEKMAGFMTVHEELKVFEKGQVHPTSVWMTACCDP